MKTEIYEVTKKIETVPLAGRKISSRSEDTGLVLKYYKWRYALRKEPCFAVAGKDEYLSEFSRKESGSVYIPLATLKAHSTFRIVIGRKGSRKTYLFTECHIDHDVFKAVCEAVSDETLQPKEVHPVLMRSAA